MKYKYMISFSSNALDLFLRHEFSWVFHEIFIVIIFLQGCHSLPVVDESASPAKTSQLKSSVLRSFEAANVSLFFILLLLELFISPESLNLDEKFLYENELGGSASTRYWIISLVGI